MEQKFTYLEVRSELYIFPSVCSVLEHNGSMAASASQTICLCLCGVNVRPHATLASELT